MATATLTQPGMKRVDAIDVLLVVLEHGRVRGRNLRLAALLHQPERFAHDIHVVAEVAHAIVGHLGQFLEERHLGADVVDQFAHGQHGVGGEVAGADVARDVVARIADHRIGGNVMVEDVGRLLRDGDEVLRLLGGDGVVQRVRGGDRADQDQHDQPHALLSVVRAVRKADAGAGENQQRANPEWRRLGALREPRIVPVLEDQLSKGAEAAPRTAKPTIGENSSDLPMFVACPQSTPLVPVLGAIS